MKKTLLMVASSAVALTLAAYAQGPGAKDTVVIKKDVTTVKKETLAAPGSVPKPKVTRDPFFNTGAGTASSLAPPPAAARAAVVTPVSNPVQPRMAPAAPRPPKPIIARPKVTVQGIVSSGYGNRAIVQGPSSTFLVKPGDKLGDYRVASISPKVVTFTYKDKRFPIKLEDEFSAGKK